jgi:hypothetical protein
LRFSPWPIDRTPSAIAFRFRVEDAERAAVFQLNEGSSVVLEIDEFRIEYYLDAGQDPTGLETRLRAIADDLRASRDFMVALGCEFHARQDVHILDIGSDLGVVTEKSFLFELSKRHVDSDPETSVRATVAHEFTHVFQLIGLGGTWPDDLSEDFWIEGNAEYGADEVFDGNDYLIFDPYDEAVSSRGLRFHQNGMSYRRVTFWKSLKAQNGSFNVCEMIDAYVDNGRNGIAGLGALLGGDDARLEAYATFIAAWNHVRTENLLEDADVWFGDGDTPEFATRVGGRAVDGAQEYRWKENMHSTPGGESAILEVEDGGTMEIEVISPTDGYLLYVYDAEGERLAELNSGARTTRVDVTADVYLSLGVRQDGMVMWTNNLEIEVVARLECEDGDCGICAGDGAPCGGSGPSFDDGCCEGSICVVGACRPDDGARERGSCDTTEGCASGLVCKPVGSMEAARTCCARDTDYCESKADCCGFMDCTDNRCVGRTSGQECLSGDCVGVSFCDSGTCT